MGDMNVYFDIVGRDMFSDTLKKAKNNVSDFSKEHETQMNKVSNKTKEIKNQNEKMGDSFNQLTSKIKTFAMTYLSISAMKKGFHEFAYLDKYIQKIGIISHTSGQSLKDLQNDLRLVSKETGAGLIELARGGAEMASLGLSTNKIKPYLDFATKIQAISKQELGIQEISTMMAVMKKNFPLAEAEEMGDTISWMLDKVPNINFMELSNSLGRSAPLAKQLGVSMQELLAIESEDVVNIGGLRASNRMMNVLREVDSEKKNIANKLKITNIDTTSKGGFIKFLNEVNDKFKGIGREGRIIKLKEVFGDNEVMQSVNSYIDNLEEINKLYKNLDTNAKGFATTGSDQMFKSDYTLLKQIGQDIQNIFINIGQILSNLGIPQKIKSITDAMEKFTKMGVNATDPMKNKLSTTDYIAGGVAGFMGSKLLLKGATTGITKILPKVAMATPYGKVLGTAGLGAYAAYKYFNKDKTTEKLGSTETKTTQNLEITINNETTNPIKVSNIENKTSNNIKSNIDIRKRDYLNR